VVAAKSTNDLLAQLDAWLGESGTAAVPTPAELAPFVSHRNNVVAAKAASCAARHRLTALVDPLAAAFARFSANGVKTDRRCVAKKGLVKALDTLAFDNRDWFLAATRCVQLDPVWGGTDDTGAEVRCQAARSLGRFPWYAVARRLAELTGDPIPTVRVCAVEVIASFGGSEPAIAILARLMGGDPVDEVTGTCLRALLSFDTDEYLDLVAGYLESDRDGVRVEAALALGECRHARSFAILRDAFGRTAAIQEKRTLALAISLLRSEEAVAFVKEYKEETANPESRSQGSVVGGQGTPYF
jgi:hypothetical protein